ncbi:MAG: agmatine deiminase family protein [Pseudomonadota bacterium]
MTSRPTPKQQGFSMPPEWAPHARTWMMWPCRAEVWDDMAATRQNYADVAHAIRDFEALTMAVRPGDAAGARNLLGSDVDLFEVALDDSWARDAGPCFLTRADGRLAGAAFGFNAWGGKYAPFDSDDAFADAVLAEAGATPFTSPLIAEGGGISVDGEGTILTTESCFPNANRNPDWSRAAIETELCEMLGGETVIWLPGNALETETDGHVDGIAAFVAPGVVLAESPEGMESPWREIVQANLDALSQAVDARGRALEIVTIPEAYDAPSECEMFCRSYVNSYLVNGAVVMPSYGNATDGQAREIFQELFPGRRVAGVNIDQIAIGGGGIHCITQQQPA